MNTTTNPVPGTPENPIVLNFHSDPGHGWLECTAGLLRSLGIAHKVTPYSYRGEGYTVYLEEDCDAPLLLQALRAKGTCFRVNELDQARGDSFVRRLPRYMPQLDDMPLTTTAEA